MSHSNSGASHGTLRITSAQDENATARLHELVGDSVGIGAAPDNAIVLDASDLAPHHLSVRHIEGRDYLMVDLAARWRERDWTWFKIRAGDVVWCPRHGSIKRPRRRGLCPECRTRRGSLWLLRPLSDGDAFDIGRHYHATYLAYKPGQTRLTLARKTMPAGSVAPLSSASLPTDDSNLWCWQPAGAPFPVFLHQRVNRSTTAHARQNSDREVGGLLLGDVCQDQTGQLYVVVTHTLRAEFAAETRGHLTFTHKTWQQLHNDHLAQYPDKTIVGWYHTHPGWTIFLSKWDLFIHENFFREPWQIALVIDPSLDRAGIFVWNGGAVANPQCPTEPFRLAELDGGFERTRTRGRIKLGAPV
ncbi:MAG: Mov34/MPN/PAD-1 family protein [Chloroflexi bacterium]|nr:Mov34/MPN/PAD-1 family protein [Chloroflexota bacterium]